MATILEGRSARPTSAKSQPGKFPSSPRPMSRADIANVEPVSAGEVLEVLDGVGLEVGVDADRWTLTEGGAS